MNLIPPPLAAIRRLASDPERSPQFRAHELSGDRYIIDFRYITELLDWTQWETRRQLGKAGTRHLQLNRQFYGSESKSRLIGLATDDKGRTKGLVDLRMSYAAYEADEALGNRAVDVVPEFEVIHAGSKLFIEFVEPSDLVEQAQPRYIPPMGIKRI